MFIFGNEIFFHDQFLETFIWTIFLMDGDMYKFQICIFGMFFWEKYWRAFMIVRSIR